MRGGEPARARSTCVESLQVSLAAISEPLGDSTQLEIALRGGMRFSSSCESRQAPLPFQKPPRVPSHEQQAPFLENLGKLDPRASLRFVKLIGGPVAGLARLPQIIGHAIHGVPVSAALSALGPGSSLE